MTNEVKNVPELRFPGFEDEWKEKKLGTIFTVTMGQSPNSTNYTDNPNDTILVQGNADIYKGKIWPRIYTKEITKLLERNDIILSVRAPVGEIGIAQVEACIGRGVCSIKGNKFLYYFLELFKKQNRWSRFSQGSTFESISGKDIRDLKFYVCNSEEQNKIGEFFNKLDQQIELEEQKLVKLEEQKKGYMQKIFSQELRFKDEHGNDYPSWKNYKIESLLKERNERSGEGQMLSVTINSGIVRFNELERKDNSSKDKSNYKIVKKNDIAYNSMRMWQGASGKSDYDGIVSPAYTVVYPTQITNSTFIEYNFKTHIMIHTFKINSQGLTSDTWNLKYKQLKKITIDIPILEEQEKIGSFFKKIDQLISKQKHKIEVLKENKKGFLQKMFV